MSADGVVESRTSLWSSALSLFASSSTLVRCALPALLDALGAGAALSSLGSVFPQMVWPSEHKEALFVSAGLAMAVSGALQWRNRSAPCPTDPAMRTACLQKRNASRRVYGFRVAAYLVGGWFAFVQPFLAGVSGA